MAYTLTYKVHFTNEQNQEVIADIYRKNGAAPPDVAEYECVSLELSDKSEGQTKYESTIIARELLLSLWTTDSDEITWETFITAEHDEWKIVITVDGQPYFHGFITPDEGNAAFQDKPYEVRLSASNGLSLLKDIDLVDINGNQFEGEHTLMEYIAGALKQTGLELPIRARCNYFNQQMANKQVGLEKDMFAQVKLDYRTFQSSPTEFVSCYEALMIIFDKFCRLEYWNGYWQIKNIAELQYIPNGFPDDYYVDYDINGANPVGFHETENYGQIGKSVDIYPINEDQQIYSRFAIKSAKTIFYYNIWPEIPKNNTFQQGTVYESGVATDDFDSDGDGDTSEVVGTYYKNTIDHWDQGIIDYFDLPHPAMVPTTKKFWREIYVNQFGVEIENYIKSDTDDNDGNHAFWLRSQGVPVYKGDRINFGISKRFSNDFSSSSSAVFTLVATVYIVVGNDAYRLNNSVNGLETGKAIWRKSVNLGDSLRITYAANQTTESFATLSVKSEPIPHDGILYIAFESDGPTSNTGPFQYLKDFTFEYIPFIAGGYREVKGDYWIRSQNKIFPDIAKEEVRISDAPKKVIKGSLLVGSTLAEPTFYRNGLSETRKFKELLNIARFNHSYRRMYAIDGSFNGLNFSPENNQLVKYPIGFHKRYRMVDMTNPRDFVLVPPLKMDLVKGWINASCVEVVNPSDVITITPDADYVVQKLVDKINATSAADWNSAGNAPPPGTPNFPPIAGVYSFTPRSLAIFMDTVSSSPIYSASDGGAGNSPSITETFNSVVGDARWLVYEIGADVQIDNLFTISIYGHNIAYRAEEEIIIKDGTQIGDSSSFNYIFQDNG